jgi:hypothetical protein
VVAWLEENVFEREKYTIYYNKYSVELRLIKAFYKEQKT